VLVFAKMQRKLANRKLLVIRKTYSTGTTLIKRVGGL
jgi:hypothetical protein